MRGFSSPNLVHETRARLTAISAVLVKAVKVSPKVVTNGAVSHRKPPKREAKQINATSNRRNTGTERLNTVTRKRLRERSASEPPSRRASILQGVNSNRLYATAPWEAMNMRKIKAP